MSSEEETQLQHLSEEDISQTLSSPSESNNLSLQESQNPRFSPCIYRCIATLRGDSYVSSLAVDGDSLYAASSDGHIRVWSLDMATADDSNNVHSSSAVAVTDSAVKCLVAAGDGLVSSHQDGKIRVWHGDHRRNGGGRLSLRAALPTAADCLRTFLFAKNYVEVRRHRKRTWVHHVDAVTALALSPDGEHMYSVSWDRSLKAWRLRDLRCVESVAAAHDDAINAVAAATDGRVFTGSADGTVKAWRRHADGQRRLALVGTMARHRSAVNALAVAPAPGGAGAGRQVIVLYSGACDTTVVVWEGASGGGGDMAAAATLRGHGGAVLCLAAAGSVVCSGSADRTVRVWRRGSPPAGGYTCLAVLDGHAGAVKSLAVVGKLGGDHHGGERCSCGGGCSAAIVCSGSLDCDVKIWRVSASCL
ncbi:hypothetical protein ACP4OV_017437 [Aristida adscensionis]